ncbi:MAG: hypothetical protein LBS57_10680 [Treponema sp.]|nr:hypothetical protein [Treponema sp.]
MQNQDFLEKLEKLRKIIAAKDADLLAIENQNHFSWLTGGRGFIGIASTAACASLVIGMDRVYLVSDNIEARRLFGEQLSENPLIEILEYPWDKPEEKQKITDRRFSGKKIITEQDVREELFEIRTVLSEYDIARYREICAAAALELEEACRSLTEGISEYEFTGELSKRFWKRNLEPVTLLVGFDERALRFRHPVPAGAKLKNYCLAAACVRRGGLVASLTRLVSLSRDETMMRRQEAASYVEAVLCSHTAAGADLATVFNKGLEAYTAQGWEGEWKYHHQGGLTGYNVREIKALHVLHHIIRPGEAYAWNPSVEGAKSENTSLITERGRENLTHTGIYPYLEFEINGEKILTEDILVLDE